MVRVVKCPLCNKSIKTNAKHFFRHCGVAFDINRYVVVEGFTIKKNEKNVKNDKITVMLKPNLNKD